MIRSLAGAVWGISDSSERLVTVFRVYYDASGTEGSAAHVVVAGIAGTVSGWERVENCWSSLLEEEGVSNFHMKEFAHFRGPFTEWRGQEDRRASFLRKLIAIASSGVDRAFITAFHAPNTKALQEEIGSPQGAYAFAAASCIVRACDWYEGRPHRSGIHHLVEAGDTGQAPLRAAMDANSAWMGGYSVLPKVDDAGNRVRPFEVADLIAYEYRKYLDSPRLRRLLRPREPFLLLAEAIPTEARYVSVKVIRRFLRRHPEIQLQLSGR